jgi:hypothetical protein
MVSRRVADISEYSEQLNDKFRENRFPRPVDEAAECRGKKVKLSL